MRWILVSILILVPGCTSSDGALRGERQFDERGLNTTGDVSIAQGADVRFNQSFVTIGGDMLVQGTVRFDHASLTFKGARSTLVLDGGTLIANSSLLEGRPEVVIRSGELNWSGHTLGLGGLRVEGGSATISDVFLQWRGGDEPIRVQSGLLWLRLLDLGSTVIDAAAGSVVKLTSVGTNVGNGQMQGEGRYEISHRTRITVTDASGRQVSNVKVIATSTLDPTTKADGVTDPTGLVVLDLMGSVREAGSSRELGAYIMEAPGHVGQAVVVPGFQDARLVILT